MVYFKAFCIWQAVLIFLSAAFYQYLVPLVLIREALLFCHFTAFLLALDWVIASKLWLSNLSIISINIYSIPVKKRQLRNWSMQWYKLIKRTFGNMWFHGIISKSWKYFFVLMFWKLFFCKIFPFFSIFLL